MVKVASTINSRYFYPFSNYNVIFTHCQQIFNIYNVCADNINMSNFTDKLTACYESQGLDRTHFAEIIGVPESTIRNWIRFGNIPPADILYKIANYFNLPMEYFIDGSESSIKDTEIAMIIKMRDLSDEQLKMVSFIIDKYREENKS